MDREPVLLAPDAWLVSPYFSYETEFVGPLDTPLAEGPWICIYVGGIPGEPGMHGDLRVLYKEYCAGMETLVRGFKETDLLGVFGSTEISDLLLKRAGYQIGWTGGYGRIAYLTREQFLLKPWRLSMSTLRRRSI